MCGKVLSVVKSRKMTATVSKLIQYVDAIVDEDQKKRELYSIIFLQIACYC